MFQSSNFQKLIRFTGFFLLEKTKMFICCMFVGLNLNRGLSLVAVVRGVKLDNGHFVDGLPSFAETKRWGMTICPLGSKNQLAGGRDCLNYSYWFVHSFWLTLLELLILSLRVRVRDKTNTRVYVYNTRVLVKITWVKRVVSLSSISFLSGNGEDST